MSAAASALDMRLRARLDSIRQSMQPRDTPSSFVSLPSDLSLSMPMSSLAFERNLERNLERRPSTLIAVQSCPPRGSASSSDSVPMVHLCWMVGVGIAIAAGLILYLRRGKKQCERKLRKSVARKRTEMRSESVPFSEPDSSDDDEGGATILPVAPAVHHHNHTVPEYEDDTPPPHHSQTPLHHHQVQYVQSHQPHPTNEQAALFTSSQGSSFTF
jgi:hypothetical protein